jgi:hypothetical protein
MWKLCPAIIILVLGGVAPAAAAGETAQATESAETKWPTDAPLRTGMIAIRDLVRLNHSLITHRRMPPDHAARFAKAIEAQTATILATSTISGPAKARLGELLGEVTAGVDAVAHPERGVVAIDGLVRIDEALARYPLLFDHPGWAPVQSLE